MILSRPPINEGLEFLGLPIKKFKLKIEFLAQN